MYLNNALYNTPGCIIVVPGLLLHANDKQFAAKRAGMLRIHQSLPNHLPNRQQGFTKAGDIPLPRLCIVHFKDSQIW